ncbi:alpha/beta hydrolase [uncultured Agrobacterium sp.]|uniref:alpha/beta fold hydrolase n=1 Tax=uncultured Agrobacterium sp. TaxID=157277 RepID=UPI0025E7B054|nr:alpha/beta hydrolase [uncultured Agrobacterium sp.]
MMPAFVSRGEGHFLHVSDWGEGPPVLFLAGWAMDGRIWGETRLHLNDAGLRTIAYDRNGHGRSTDRASYSYDTLADDLAVVLRSLDLSNVTLVAHSGAGGEAIRYLSRYNDNRIKRLILVGATGPKIIGVGGVTLETMDSLCGELSSNLSGWIDANLELFAPGAPTRVKDWMGLMAMDCSRRALIEFQRTIALCDLSSEAGDLKLPVTIIHGDRDVSAPLESSGRVYAATIPGAELVVYEGVAHGIMVTHASKLADDIRRRVLA